MVSSLKQPATGAVLFEGHLWPGAELEWDTIGGPQPLQNAVTAIKNIAYAGDPNWNPGTFTIATDVERVAAGRQRACCDPTTPT